MDKDKERKKILKKRINEADKAVVVSIKGRTLTRSLLNLNSLELYGLLTRLSDEIKQLLLSDKGKL